MSDLTPVATPTPVIIPDPPSPTADLEAEADSALRYLQMFTNSKNLDTDIRMGMLEVHNTIRMLKIAVMSLSKEAQRNHDRAVELSKAQRLIGN